MKPYAQEAYEAYVDEFPGPASDIARDYRPWESLSEEMKLVWAKVANAAIHAHARRTGEA